MRAKVAAAIALAFALAATSASAGVVISQNVDVRSQAGESKSVETVTIQGNKQRIVSGDRVQIYDLDAGKTYILKPDVKEFAVFSFPPAGVMAALIIRQGIAVELNKSKTTKKLYGYECRDYAGATNTGHYNVNAIECVASAAPGAGEYVAFRKLMVEKLKGTPLQPKGEVPDGIPVASIVTASLIPFPVPPGFPPELLAKLKEERAKEKPEVTSTSVSKIEVKDIAASEFEVPAGYTKPKVATPAMPAAPPAQ